MRRRKFSTIEIGLFVTLIIGLMSVVAISRTIDNHRPTADTVIEEDRLYVTATVVSRFALGFNGLAADWYWMRSLQYVGRKIVGLPENIQLDSLGQLNLKLLAPLLDAATSLDPQFMEPYQYAAVVLPTVDVDEAIRITKKGIVANPNAWRLYQHLGYIYWQRQDFANAGEAYSKGATLPGAPTWMKAMKARMASEGGSRDTARQIYRSIYDEAGDEQVKEMARRRLFQVDAMDEQDALRREMAAYRSRTGHCPSNWQELESVFRSSRTRTDSSGAPIDPAGTAYLLIKEKCDVEIDWHSQVPVK